METDAIEANSGSVRRACDQCRLRKIRCDKESPCSNCRSARRSCSSTGAGQKPKEARQRVLISSQYERKIDQIEARLEGIENLLQRLLANSSGGSSAAASTPSGHLGAAPGARRHSSEVSHGSHVSRSSLREDGPEPSSSTQGDVGPDASGADGTRHEDAFLDPEDSDAFEGNSSLAAHTAFASEFLADAVQRTSLRTGAETSKIDAALSSLRQMVDLQKDRKQKNATASALDASASNYWSSQKHLPKTKLQDLPLPPMGLVVEKLREMRHGPVPVMLAIIYCFTDIDHFTEHCRRLYFRAEDQEPAESTFILVNAGLLYMFFEAGLAETDPAQKARYEHCHKTCQRNLEIALAQLNLMMPATADNIEALLMSASFCIDESRASLAWLLVSRAAHMCRTLGWHQAHTMAADPPAARAAKSLLFWCTYMLDKALALRLGRAANLQDYDISLPAAAVVPDAGARGAPAYPGREVMALWIGHARALGRIYERLYSPGALRQPDAARVAEAGRLAREQHRLFDENNQLLAEFEHRPGPEARMFFLTLKSDQVSYLSNLTLTYRAMPPDPAAGLGGGRSRTFSDECVNMARASMRCHLEAMSVMDDQSLKIVYIHWTILYAPFIPFIVIFCLVIETPECGSADLRCLADFVASLEAACDVSAGVSKLHQLCRVLYHVASLYVEAKAQEPNADRQDAVLPAVGDEFDMYLSQLGFMPFGSGGAAAGGGGGEQAMAAGVETGDIGMADATAAAAAARSATQTSQLGDWFSGNNYMMGLLEEDLSGINPSGWFS
ncbi:hypothetical protein F4780DRAFT_792412 [Xylariomycetidae sp. FL0641]|nr:hypothetical protein F4780DRAFT_792412 [Xylariomycetidae sp. FL0641]